MSTSVPLQRFYPSSPDIQIPINEHLFEPDNWTEALANGLRKPLDSGCFKGKSVTEIGVGSGINLAGVWTHANRPAQFTGADITLEAAHASQTVVADNNLRGDIWVGQSDLLTDIPDERLAATDVIFACIPQLIKPIGDLEVTDPESHYYESHGSVWDRFGLGLNADLLDQAKIKVPHAEVILNLCGRPSLDTLQKFFADHDRDCEVLHEEIVQQHPGSSVSSLAAEEATTGHVFEFFRDAAGTKQICATEAEQLRVAKEAVYHKIYVIKGSAPKLAA